MTTEKPVPAGWERRPDGTLVRRPPAPFSVAWLRERDAVRGERTARALPQEGDELDTRAAWGDR